MEGEDGYQLYFCDCCRAENPRKPPCFTIRSGEFRPENCLLDGTEVYWVKCGPVKDTLRDDILEQAFEKFAYGEEGEGEE